MEFRILGPLEVVEDGNPVALGTLKERLVLGVLLLHANEFVSRERIVDDLWGEAPPPTARKAVNVYVSQLRKALGRDGSDPIATAVGGYRLQVEPDAVDANRVQQLVSGARERVAEGELESAAEGFRQALSLWRGPTLAGLELESRGRDEVAQLDELRLAALMDRIDCDLALGRHEEVLGELNVLVHEHPLRERLRAQQMLALYRADRQAEALEAYGEARQTLVDDLGIEPSEGLRRLQQAILRHDPSLESPEGTAAVNGVAPTQDAPSSPPEMPARPERGRAGTRFRPRRWQLVLAAVVILAGAATAAAALSSSAGAHIVPNSLVELNPRTGKPILVARVGALPGPIAITRTAVWTANYGDDTVSRYDLRTHRVVTRGVTPGQPFDIVFDPRGNGWITNTPADDNPKPTSVVVRLEAGSGGTSGEQLFPSHVQDVRFPLDMAGFEAQGGGHVWVIVGYHGPLPRDNRVAVVNVLTDSVSVLHLDESATSIAYGYDTAWIGTYGAGGYASAHIAKLNYDSRIEAFRPGQSKPEVIVLDKHGANWGPGSIAAGDGAVWATTFSSHQLVKIDPITLRIISRNDLPPDCASVAVGAGGVWLEGDHSICKVDPQTLKVVRRFTLVHGNVGQLCGIAATSRQLWVTSGDVNCNTIGS